jgi:glycosyltransferase involved in cell wall biosynthesis
VRDGRKQCDVAFYVPWIGPLLARDHGLSTGGAETQVFLLSRALTRRGLRVCLLVFEMPGVHIPSTVDGVDVVLRRPYKSHQRLLGKVRETVSIRGALTSVESDVVVTRAAGPHVGLIAFFARRKRFVFSSASPLDFDFLRIASKRRDRVLMSIGMRFADEIVVQTEEQFRSCRQRLGRTPVLIRSLCELPNKRDVTPEAFLWIGRYKGYKRPLEYLELARSMPEARFLMVASSTTWTDEASEFKRQIEAAATSLPNLELLHSLPRPELMRLVERAVAVVSTSEFEGMSNVLLEGWARGVPALVFSYDSDGLVERHGLGHVAGGSRQRFVEQARELWTTRFERSEMSARCRAYVEEHHAPERIAEQWEDALVGRSVRAATNVVAVEHA